jgi:hypothetical protein
VKLSIQKQKGYTIKATRLSNKHFMYPMFYEIFLALIHPNMLFYNKTYITNKYWYMEEMTVNINDFFILIVLSRVYILARTMITITPLYSLRTHRISSIVGLKLSYSFALRCLLASKPYRFICIACLITIFPFAYMLKVVEGPVYLIDKDSQTFKIDYRIFGNCFWNVLVTMTTVGYGDMYPKTNLGRLICLIAGFCGVVVLSFVVIALTNDFTLSENEEKVLSY